MGRSIACVYSVIPQAYEYDEVLRAASRAPLPPAHADARLPVEVWTRDAGEAAEPPRPLRPLGLTPARVQAVVDEALAAADPPPYAPGPVPAVMMSDADIGDGAGVTLDAEHHVAWADLYLCRLSNGLPLNYKVHPKCCIRTAVRRWRRGGIPPPPPGPPSPPSNVWG